MRVGCSLDLYLKRVCRLSPLRRWEGRQFSACYRESSRFRKKAGGRPFFSNPMLLIFSRFLKKLGDQVLQFLKSQLPQTHYLCDLLGGVGIVE